MSSTATAAAVRRTALGPPGSPYDPPPGQPPSSGMSNKAKFWIGVAARPARAHRRRSHPAVPGRRWWTASGVTRRWGPFVSGVIALALLVGFVLMIVFERTRFLALGLLAGTAILFVLAAGACVALLVAYSNSYS